jgi:DNA-binding transcriptional regulator YiaG
MKTPLPVATVETWTGFEARILRLASRSTVVVFAERLGVGTRTISKWEARGHTIEPKPEFQAILDTALSRADNATQVRFFNMRLRGAPAPRSDPSDL